MQLIVVRHKLVQFDRGYAGFFISQVTEVRLGKVIGFVRENRRATSEENFMMSSTTRLGHKADGDRIGIEVLELAAPGPIWKVMAAEVARLDNLRRPVWRHPRWNIEAAYAALTKKFSERFG